MATRKAEEEHRRRVLVLLRIALIRFRGLGGKVCREDQKKVATAFESLLLELFRFNDISGNELREVESRVEGMAALEEQWRKLGE